MATQVLEGNLHKGLKMFREIDYFIGGIRTPKIIVYYFEYLESPTGDKIHEQYKKYILEDKPAVYDDSGNLISEATLSYTNWKTKIITQSLVGVKLGDDIIIKSIINRLASMPFDVEDNHIETN